MQDLISFKVADLAVELILANEMRSERQYVTR